jgi:hypothetical protein
MKDTFNQLVKKEKHPKVLLSKYQPNILRLSQQQQRIELDCRFASTNLFKKTIVAEGGCRLSDISTSRATVHRQRLSAREKAVAKIKEEWKLNKPEKAILSWDTKFFRSLSGRGEERIAILTAAQLMGKIGHCLNINDTKS